MNKKSIIIEAQQIVLERKQIAEQTAENNYKLAREKSKDFKKIDLLYREKMFDFGKNEEQNNLEIEKIKKERIFELKKIGLTQKDLLPQYFCSICNDTGYQNGKKCVCLKKEIQKLLIKNSGITSSIVHNFSHSDPKILENNEMLRKAHALCKAYSEKFPNIKTKNLVFMGEVGTGKTFLLECIANELLNKEFYVCYLTAFNLSNTMLKALTLSPIERDTIISPLLECDLLIVDDLGSEPMYKNLSASNLFSILNERDINGKPTLISTNLNFDAIESRYGNRVFSRMFNKRTTKVIKFFGSDLRIN